MSIPRSKFDFKILLFGLPLAVIRYSTVMGSRGWCFTLHATDVAVGRDQYLPPEEHKDTVYMVWQEEKGEGGAIHLQGYIYFGDKKPRMAWVKENVFPNSPHVHLEAAKGTPEQNRKYCTKQEGRVDGPWEYGKLPKGQGARSDLHALAAELKETGGDLRLLDEKWDAKFVQYGRGIKGLAELQQARARMKGEVKNRDVKVHIYWGAPGSGKTHSAHQFEDTYTLAQYSDKTLWFDGYYGQKTLIIDEFDYRNLPITVFNQICDIYPYNAPVKGGFVVAKWTNVVICSNIDPLTWYGSETAALRNAYKRRITSVVEFKAPRRDNRFAGEAEQVDDEVVEIQLPQAQVREYRSGAGAGARQIIDLSQE